MRRVKDLMIPEIEEQEGFKPKVYKDNIHQIPTIGNGFNLQDEEVKGLLAAHGRSPDRLLAGEEELDRETNDMIREKVLDRKLELSRNKLGSDFFDYLPEHQQAVIGNLGYQSLNNIGPNLTSFIANKDNLGAVREIAGYTNKHNDPGIQVRRLKQAKAFAGDEFDSIMQQLDPETKKKIWNNVQGIENENTRKEVMEAFGKYLKDPRFKKLFK